MKIRVVIAEDQAMVLGALGALLSLEPDIEVVGQARDGLAAFRLIRDLRPELILTDIEMPQMTGLELAAEVKKLRLPCRVIILTTFARSGYLRRALDAGVAGYLLKDAPSKILAAAIRKVHAGQRAIDPELAAEAWSESDPLTDRERQVLRFASEGVTGAEIASRLKLSEGTIRNYLSEAISKLGAANRTDAARMARQKGWLWNPLISSFSAMRTASVYVLALSLLAISQMAKALDCQALTNVKLADTRVTEAQSIPAGSFTPDGADPIKHVDSFCRVSGVITPTADSYIRFEVWLPENWNGKYLGVGNGGFAGSIAYSALANNVNAGYATAATDTGHQAEGVDASWAYKHPEKITDFGYRALHLTTLNAKSLVKQFYQKTPDRSYFSSCSDGGREALMEAQRFPADFDGILAGAPANYWTHLVSNGIGLTKQLVSPAGYISAFKLSAIHKAALDTCDAVDGVKDGVINDPTRCHFDPAILLCKEHESTHCLTAPQIDTLHSLYSGSKDSKGNSIFPGFIPGSEDGWNAWIIGFGPGGSYQYVYLVNYFRYMVYDDPAWNVFRASVDDAEKRAEQTTAHALDAVNPDLHAFQSRGGKLILYHGWNDAAIPAGNTINYFENVKKTMGSENALKFVRLYMVPGMQHCGGGPGVNSFGQGAPSKTDTPANNAFTALQEWVETGKAPEQITATKYVGDSSSKGVAFTRPLCPYPQIAKYSGSGDTKDAANFSCAAN